MKANMKDSGISWIGEIPENWKVSKIKYLIRTKITDGPHETPNFLSEGIPFLSVDGIKDGELDLVNTRFISQESYDLYNKKAKIEFGDILMGKAASIGKIARVKNNIKFGIWSPLALIKPNFDKISSNFMEYSLKSLIGQYQIEILANNNTQKNISMDDIPKILLIIPPLSQQQKIADFLDKKTEKINTFIKNKKDIIKLLQEQKTSIINKAVTKGIDENVKMKDSGIAWIGEIPENWEVRKFKGLTKILTCGLASTPEYVSEKIGIPFLSAQNVRPHRMDLSKFNYISKELHEKLIKYRKPEKGDVLVTRVGAGIGQACIVDTDLEFSIYVSLTHIRPNDEILSKYIVYFFDTDYSKKLNLVGTVEAGGQGNLNVKNVEKYQIPLPSIEEQKEIINFLDVETKKIDNAIEKIENEISLIQEYKDSLIYHAVNGKIDI